MKSQGGIYLEPSFLHRQESLGLKSTVGLDSRLRGNDDNLVFTAKECAIRDLPLFQQITQIDNCRIRARNIGRHDQRVIGEHAKAAAIHDYRAP